MQPGKGAFAALTLSGHPINAVGLPCMSGALQASYSTFTLFGGGWSRLLFLLLLLLLGRILISLRGRRQSIFVGVHAQYKQNDKEAGVCVTLAWHASFRMLEICSRLANVHAVGMQLRFVCIRSTGLTDISASCPQCSCQVLVTWRASMWGYAPRR
jgi:hypothetical protein